MYQFNNKVPAKVILIIKKAQVIDHGYMGTWVH